MTIPEKYQAHSNGFNQLLSELDNFYDGLFSHIKTSKDKI